MRTRRFFLYIIVAALLIVASVTHSRCGEYSVAHPGVADLGRVLPSGNLAWESIGPSGGTINTITYHPQVNGLVYLGTFDQGLYASRNGGDDWSRLTSDRASIRFVLIDPFDPSAILVGAENWFLASGYLHRSTDWGQTWEEDFEGENLTTAAFDPTQPGILYMSVGADADWAPAEFYRSTDAGASWSLMNPNGTYKEGLFVWGFFDILVNPEDGSILAFTLFTSGMGETENHVCRSSDGGLTWDYMDTGLYDSQAWDFARVYPGIDAAATKDGLYVHLDGGNIWHGIPNQMGGINCIELAPGPTGKVWYLVESDYYSSVDPDVIHRSSNRGRNWVPLSLVDDPCEITTVAADPQAAPGSETVMAGTWESGVFSSSDQGENWEMKNTGLAPIPCTSLEFGSAGSGLLYAGAEGIFQAGLYKSSDLGTTWERANDGLAGGTISSIVADPENENRVFAASQAKGIFRSTDQGGTWTRLVNGLPENSYTNRLVLYPTDPEKIYACMEYGLFRSSDGGDTWLPLGQGMEKTFVRDLSIDPTNPGHMFAAVDTDGIYESHDGGGTWQRVLDETYWKDFVSVAVVPGGERVYAGMLFTSQFYRSTDGGDTWDVVLDRVAESIVVGIDNPLAVACGGSGTDVWFSLDGGDSWFTQPGGLENVDVNELVIPPSGESFIYVATSAGIQRLSHGTP